MRIYYFSSALFPSASAESVHVMKMCEGLSRLHANMDVVLFGRGGSKKSGPAEIYRFYGAEALASLCLSPAWGRAANFLHTLYMAVRLGPPDVFYGRDPVTLYFASWMDAPVCMELHKMPAGLRAAFFMKKLLARARFSSLIVTSEMLKREVLERFPGLAADKVLVARNGSDPAAAKNPMPAETRGRLGHVQVGHIGSLDNAHGAQLLLEVAERVPELDFHFVGGRPRQIAALKKKAPQNVFFYGYVPHTRLQAYMAAFDILVAPFQKTGRNGGLDVTGDGWSPLKLFEYMSSGKPLCCSDLPAFREFLEHGRNCLLVPSGTASAWVDALSVLARDANIRKLLAYEAEKDLREKYTWEIRARRVLEFVKRR